jgi:hypothetical protein
MHAILSKVRGVGRRAAQGRKRIAGFSLVYTPKMTGFREQYGETYFSHGRKLAAFGDAQLPASGK